MSDGPWLSVVMPVYEGARYVCAAIESLGRGGLEGVEVVVTDDGSRDGTPQLAAEAGAHLGIRVLVRPHDGNWVRGTNLALAAAGGRWATVLHQDDAWFPERLPAIRRELAAHPTTRLLLHDARFIGPDGRRLGTWRCPLPEGEVAPATLLERLLVQNFVAMPSPVFLREAVLESGGLDEDLWYAADWDLWLRLGRTGPVRHLARPLAAFRIHPESQTVTRARAAGELRAQLAAVLERHLAAAPPRVRRVAEGPAWLSLELNVLLAAAARGAPVGPGALLRRLLAAGPRGTARFLRWSRLHERLGARLRLRRRSGR